MSKKQLTILTILKTHGKLYESELRDILETHGYVISADDHGKYEYLEEMINLNLIRYIAGKLVLSNNGIAIIGGAIE